MTTEIDDGLTALRHVVRDFTEREVAPRANACDCESRYPEETFQALAAADLLGLSLPTSYGGGGGGMQALCVAIEEVARCCNSTALMLLLSQLAAGPLVLSGRPDLCQRYVSRVARGDLRGSFCLTEPQAGSDVRAIRTRAVPADDGYVLDGSKAYISGAPLADFYIVWGKVAEHGRDEIAGFVVDRGTEGLSIGHVDDKLGVRAVPTSEVVLSQVRIPAGNRFTRPGEGLHHLMECLTVARPGVAARGLGLAEGAFEYAATYARDRVAFGSPLLDIQAVQFLLADLAIGIEGVRGLVQSAALLVDREGGGRAVAPHVAMAKCAAGDLAVKAASDAIQVLGAAGYMKDHPLERFYRDAKQLQIVEGTSQIQRLIIGRAIRDKTYAP
jgi:alkylation response protein AidB-like acyl-CoA dehydrogenase